MSLVAPELLARLAGLDLVLRRALPSNLRGERRSVRRRGLSVEFADHRGYVPGDDVRHLDWAALARLDQLVLKLYHDEEDLQLHLVVDDSASMAFGEPSKAFFARQVAAVFAWIGLGASHRVTVTCLGGEPAPLVPGRDAAAFARVVEHLEKPPAGGKRPLHLGLRAFHAALRPRGLVVLVSDLFDAAGPGAVLAELQRPDTEVSVVQVFAPDELDPAYEEDLRLVDSETGERVEITAGPSLLDAYRRRAKAFVASCAETARRRGAGFAFTTTAVSLEDFVLRSLVEEGLLR